MEGLEVLCLKPFETLLHLCENLIFLPEFSGGGGKKLRDLRYLSFHVNPIGPRRQHCN